MLNLPNIKNLLRLAIENFVGVAFHDGRNGPTVSEIYYACRGGGDEEQSAFGVRRQPKRKEDSAQPKDSK